MVTPMTTAAGSGPGRSVLPAPRGARWLVVGLITAVLLALAGTALPTGGAAAATPAAPIKLSPDDASGTMLWNLELTWRAVPGATSYEVQVSDTGRFTGQLLTGSPTLSRWTVPTTLPAGDYVWRVRAASASGSGAWSRVADFTRGWSDTPGSPVKVANGVLPAVSWGPIPDASFYEVEFSRVPLDIGSAPYEGTLHHYTCYTTHTFFSPYGLIAGEENPPGDEGSCAFDVVPEPAAAGTELDGKFHADTTYYWRVRARNGTVDERETPFTMPAVACTGIWFDSGIKASEPTQPAPNPDGTTPTGPPAEGGVVVTVPIGGKPPRYDAAPECSQWAEGGSFDVQPVEVGLARPPIPNGLSVEPTLGSPSAATVATVDTPLFRWTPVPGAVKYRVYLSRTADVRDADHIWETYGPSLMPLGTLADRGLKTYWTVQACTFDTFCSNPAPVRSFTKSSAVVVAPSSTSTSGFAALLTWTVQNPAARSGQVVPAGPNAKAYQVQVTDDDSFAEPVIDVTVDRIADLGDETTSRLAIDTHSLLDGKYRWRVRPVDEAGQDLPWGAGTGSFVINRQKPVVAVQKPVRSLAAQGPLWLKFSEPVTGVSSRTVGVKVANTSTRVSGWLRKVGAATWAFTPSRPWLTGQSYTVWATGAVKDAGGSAVLPIRYAVRASTRAEAGSAAVRARAGDYRWARVSASDATGGSYLRTSDRPSTSARASLTATVVGTRVHLVGCRTPASGIASVRVDGRSYRVDLYRSYSGCGRVWTSPRLPDRTHTVVVSTTGSKRAASRGYQLGVDTISVS